jgi:hypothetical protein
MGQRDFPRMRPAPPADQPGVADSMMRSTEWLMSNERDLRRGVEGGSVSLLDEVGIDEGIPHQNVA